MISENDVVARLVLVNGAPGSGKSTLAEHLAAGQPMALALDIDVVKHSLDGWQDDPTGSGFEARRSFLTTAEVQLQAGYDVYVGQFLAKVDFIEQLEALAEATESELIELVLVIDENTLAKRLEDRRLHPTRPEHAVNNVLVSSADAPEFISDIDALLAVRPRAVRIDASGSESETLRAIRESLER